MQYVAEVGGDVRGDSGDTTVEGLTATSDAIGATDSEGGAADTLAAGALTELEEG
jgi:hypothetical protein